MFVFCIDYDSDSIKKWSYKDYVGDILVCRATLIVNIRNSLGDPVGIIEDVWTHEKYRKQGLASNAIKQLLDIAKQQKCYKVVLDCADHNIHFYEQIGFKKWQNSMRIDI